MFCSLGIMATADPQPLPSSARPARPGLFGGLVSSKQAAPKPDTAEADKAKKAKAKLQFKVVLTDALDLIRARRGRLAFGLFLMAINRMAALVLPATTKYLVDDVIGKGNRHLLYLLMLASGDAVPAPRPLRLVRWLAIATLVVS